MRILSIIQPSEMGSDFRFDEEAGLWKVNFPAGMGEGGGVPLSTDNNNAIGLGSDEGVFISTDLLGAYALTQDNGSKKINLYRFPVGTEFDPETATLVSSVNLIELSGIFDDVAIDGDVITFTDADTGLTLSIDTANLQKVSDIVGSDSVEVISIDGVTQINIKVDPNPDNLIEVDEGGLFVDANRLQVGDPELHQTLAPVENGLCHVVGNSHLVVPQIELVDVAGNPIGYINDIIGLPVSSIVATDDHCTDWHPPEGSDVPNCRIGKVGNFFRDDWIYNSNDKSYMWRIFLNGQDTGYVAKALDDEPAAASLMSLSDMPHAQDVDLGETFGDGYLEEIISVATNGSIGGYYVNGLYLWNNTNQQQVITLYPNGPINLNQLRDATSIESFGASIVPELVELSDAPRTEYIPSFDTDPDDWSLYFDEERVAVHICLAPNSAGTGGSTGPQISCYGATDRFATSGLWNRWTVKINGQTVITNGNSGDVVQAMEQHGILVNYNGEMETTYRNMTNNDIRIEMIATLPENQWDRNYLEIDTSTNPTLMGYDPIQHQVEAAMMAKGKMLLEESPQQYQRITVCLAPFNDWMNWDYKDLDTSTALVTLTNSAKLENVEQDFYLEGEAFITVRNGGDKWGDYTWTIQSDVPQRLDVTLTITSESYNDEYTCEFFARRPMVITLANTHEWARPFEVTSPLDANAVTITSIEVVGKKGSTLISNPEDGLVIDADTGAVRIDDLENGQFSYIVQGRFVDSDVADKMKVKFVTDTDLEEVVTVDLTTNSNPDFQPISTYQNSKVVIGLVDDAGYTDVRNLPAIRIESPDWAGTHLYRTNMVGGEATMEFDFSQASTYKLYIHAYLGTGSGHLAILGDCVIGVDDWGEVEASGYTFNQETYNARFIEDGGLDFSNISKNNLAYVPKEGPSNLQNMTGMFAGTDLSDPSVDLSGYDVGGVYSMAGVFAHSNFNGNILSWNMRWVGILDYAFYASKFRQDLSEWCVLSVTDEPRLFSHRSPLPASFKPVWGTCPVPGSDTTILRHLVRDADPNEDSGLGLFTLTGKNIKVGDVVIKSDGAVIEATKQAGFNYSLNMATVVFQIRTPAGSSGLITIKHPPLHSFHINNQNYSNPKHVDVVKFGKNVKGFRLEMPYAFKVPNSIPNTIITLSRMFEGSTEFADAENIQKWDVGNVLWMDYAFARCKTLNADLRNWCVAKVLTPPTGFADGSAIPAENFPVWGTCPMGSPYIDSGVEPLAHRVTANSFITTEPMPLLTGRVSHPTAILNVYDDKVVKYTPAVNHGDGTWSCQLDYIKAPTQHRLSVEASSGITNEMSGMALMSIVTAEIEGGYWDRATSELVCTSPEGVYLRVMNGRNLGFIMSNFEATGGVLKQVTFCVTEIERTLADFKLNGPQVGDSRIEPLANSTTHYMGHKGNKNGWTFEPMASDTLRIVNEEHNLIASFNQRGNNYVTHDVVTMNKALFIHLKPVAGEVETRIKLVNIYDA